MSDSGYSPALIFLCPILIDLEPQQADFANATVMSVLALR